MHRSIVLAVLGAAVFCLSPARAEDTVRPTKAAIDVYEQASGFVLDPAAREFTSRFDATRTRMLGVNIRLVHPAPAAFQVFPVGCQIGLPDGRRVSGIFGIPVKMQPGQTESAGANTVWGVQDGQSWAPGTYTISCSGGGIKLGEVKIEMFLGPPDVPDTDIRVAGIKFFHIWNEVPAYGQREYRGWVAPQTFGKGMTRRIGVELEFRHGPLPRAVSVPIDCFFYTPDGVPTQDITFTYDAPAGQKNGQASRGIGFDEPGQWPTGTYSAVCRINGRPVAADRFRVTDN